MGHTNESTITSLDTLASLYGAKSEASIVKESAVLTPSYAAFVERSPFAVLATIGANGVDTSPRGDAPGFVRIVSPSRLAIPDRRGNNRLDSLRNIVTDPRISLLFLIPGIDETLRIRGRATITTDDDLRTSFEVDGKLPATVIVIDIDRVYFQCARALKRSRLWDGATQARRNDVPTAGQMLRDAHDAFDGEAYDADLQERQSRTLY